MKNEENNALGGIEREREQQHFFPRNGSNALLCFKIRIKIRYYHVIARGNVGYRYGENFWLLSR